MRPILIKHFRNGNGAQPVTFVRHGDQCGYAWGFPKRDFQTIPTHDLVEAERGVTWHPNFCSALIAWDRHRQTLAGGALDAPTTTRGSTSIRRPVRKPRNLQSA